MNFDEIDDLLYFTRVDETDELDQTVSELAQKYNCSESDVLSSVVDPNTGNTILHYCSANGLSELLKSVVAKLASPQEPVASDKGKQPDINFVNTANKEGNTPLHWAAYNGHLEVVKVLLSAGSDMWIKNSAGHLAMFEAERADKSEVVQYLLEAGGDRVDRAAAQNSTEEDADVNQNGENDSASGAVDVPMTEN